jgi:hypothetical protein
MNLHSGGIIVYNIVNYCSNSVCKLLERFVILSLTRWLDKSLSQMTIIVARICCDGWWKRNCKWVKSVHTKIMVGYQHPTPFQNRSLFHPVCGREFLDCDLGFTSFFRWIPRQLRLTSQCESNLLIVKLRLLILPTWHSSTLIWIKLNPRSKTQFASISIYFTEGLLVENL